MTQTSCILVLHIYGHHSRTVNSTRFILTIQEINIRSSLKIFSDTFQVIINTEPESRDGIGIVTLIKKGVRILDTIISKNGRIIGVKIENAQIWNVYPKSGTAFKQERDLFLERSCLS